MPGINPVNCEAHAEYLNAFHTAIVKRVLDLIEKQVRTPLHETPLGTQFRELVPTFLQQEVQMHAKYCKKLVHKVRPRGFEEFEDKVKKLIALNSKQEHNVVIFLGTDGCGKTVLTSRLAQLSPEILGKETYVILRYVGLTSKCKTLYSLLLGICNQMEHLLNIKSKKTTLPFADLVKKFYNFLKLLCENDRDVVIIIDDLHKLSQIPGHENAAMVAKWLSKEELPCRAHVIVSLSSDSKNNQMLNTIQGHLPNCDTLLKIPSLKENHIQQILKDRLDRAKRKLTGSQRDAVLQACLFNEGGIPLHIKLCIDQAMRLMSSTHVSDTSFASSLESMLNYAFQSLERKYGKEVMCVVSYYLSACYTGLTEMEILDLLSCNNQILMVVLKHFSLASENVLLRFPTNLWWSIRNDLGSLIQVVHVDNKKLFRWAHVIVSHTAILRYQPNIDTIKDAHKDIGDLFSEQWIGNKPMMFPEEGIEIIDTGNRLVCQQPLVYSDKLYNYRRLHELWFQQLHTGMAILNISE